MLVNSELVSENSKSMSLMKLPVLIGSDLRSNNKFLTTKPSNVISLKVSFTDYRPWIKIKFSWELEYIIPETAR